MSCDAISHDEEQLQMALWAISSAPIFMSTHVRNAFDDVSSVLHI